MLSGEKQLREKVVDLYGAVARFGGRPTESQMSQVVILAAEIEKSNVRFESIMVKDLERLNARLRSKKLTPISILTKEAFEKKSSGP